MTKTQLIPQKALIKFLLIAFTLSQLFSVFAHGHNMQDKEEAYVKFTSINDNLTRMPILPAFTVLNATDTTSIHTTYSGTNESFTLTLPDIHLDYYVIVKGRNSSLSLDTTDDGIEFKPDTLLITSKQLQDAKGFFIVPSMTLKREYARRSVQLAEATVTASKVIFYHKGDTVIYNADAFVLAEGSMLDALISQLPGVKIDGNGVITANGRKVENLLLDGKDLFNGNGGILLDNLPAYTVNKIAVYEKSGDLSEFLGRKTGDEQYVMDVRLKRDYHAGWLGNADVGYGTKSKYLAKLFTLRFADNLSLGIHFNANNLSDISHASEYDTSWDPSEMSQGVKTGQNGGIRYIAKELPNRWSANGVVNIENIHDNLTAGTMQQNYYPGGDTYDYRLNTGKNKDFKFSTSHYPTKFIGQNIKLYNMIRFSFNRTRNTGSLYSASFDSPKDSLLTNIRNGVSTDITRYADFITRTTYGNYEKGSSTSTDFSSKAVIKTKTTGLTNNVDLYGYFRYDTKHFDRFKKYSVDFASDPSSAASQYFKGHPDHTTKYIGRVQFTQYIDKSWPDKIEIFYTYTGTDAVTTSDLYLLNHLSGFDWQDSPLGMLPSGNSYLKHIDIEQSYNTKYNENKHDLTISGSKNIGMTKSVLYINLYSILTYKNRKFNYLNQIKNSQVKRHSFQPDIKLSLSYTLFDKDRESDSKNWRSSVDVNYTRKPLEISMLDAVERTNTTDPLYIRVGNPDLKDAYRNTVEVSFDNISFSSQLQQNLKLKFEQLENAIAEARYYNPENGVTTSRPVNIDGNHAFYVNYDLSTPLFHNPKWSLSTSTFADFTRSKDLSSTIMSSDIGMPNSTYAQIVKTTSFGENIRVNWQRNEHRISLFADVRHNDYRSHEKGFNDFSSWIAKYGTSAVATLPNNWSLSTDLTFYTRRGFTDSRLNTSDVVWNARLTKSIMGGSMIFAVDAYDMLRQLSNITYTVNAQARTEVVTNVVPTYVLFHVQYRFNRNPKR